MKPSARFGREPVSESIPRLGRRAGGFLLQGFDLRAYGGCILGLRRVFEIFPQLRGGSGVIVPVRQNHPQQLRGLGDLVARVEFLSLTRALLRYVLMVQIVVGDRVEEEGLRKRKGVEPHRLVCDIGNFLPPLGPKIHG